MAEDETNREQELIEQAKSANARFLEAVGDSTRALIELGNCLIELMEANKTLKNGSWKKYREKKMPWLNKKRDQRARKVAPEVDLGKHPALGFLSQRKLLQLAAIRMWPPVITRYLAGGPPFQQNRNQETLSCWTKTPE